MGDNKNKKLTKEEEEEKLDQQLLVKNTAKIDAIMQLLADGEDRDSSMEKVKRARQRVRDSEDDKESEDTGRPARGETIFHPYRGKRVAIRAKTGKVLELGDALELQIEARQHGKNLLRSLHAAAVERVGILERQLGRMD